MNSIKLPLNKAFTLVELIVVITILAILGTIGFMSFTGYALQARNSTTKNELKSIEKLIALKRVKGIDYLSLAKNDTAKITGANIQIGGADQESAFSGSYVAGDLDFLALGLDEKEYSSTTFSGGTYKYGATSSGDRYQIAATIETTSGLDSFIVGNWVARDSTTTRGARSRIEDNIFYLSGGTYHEAGFHIDDIVGIASGTYYITDLVNGNAIHLDRDINTPGANIFLRNNETRHLIKKWDSNFPIDIGRGDLYVPYK